MSDYDYAEPESITPEVLKQRLRDLDRNTRLAFMMLTIEPLDPSDERRGVRNDRRDDDRESPDRRVA
jgi:hypothetical protein